MARFVVILCAMIVVSCGIKAQSRASSTATPIVRIEEPESSRTPFFISKGQLDATILLSDPPANDSAQTKEELAELHLIQTSRSEAQIQQAKADDLEEDIFIYRDVIGPKFTRQLLPLTSLLSAHVHSDEGIIVTPAKSSFKRPRPYNLDRTLAPVCRHANDFSYPSGHSTSGYLEAFVLGAMIPEKRDAILARADEYAHNRLICGVHYTSDTKASRYVASGIIAIMMNSPSFQAEFAAAKAETRRTLGLP